MTQTNTVNNSYFKIFTFLSMIFLSLFIFVTGAFAGTPSSWANQEFKVKGTWSIEQKEDGNYLVLSDDFKTKNAPDLKFFVSNADYQSVTGGNATNGAVQIAKLSSSKGGQSYKIPASVDTSNYKTLILHCEQYSKLWASTPLK